MLTKQPQQEPNGSNRAKRIQDIIQLRQPLARNTEVIIEDLKNRLEVLKSLEEKRVLLIREVKDSKAVEGLKKIDFSGLIKNIEKSLLELYKLKERFSRTSINVGVIGKARQGKSTFLKALTQLGDDEIPTASLESCTGTRSKIYDRSTFLSKDDKYDAEVYFHTDKTFLEEVIWQYYKKLGWQDLPSSVEYFFDKALPNPNNDTTSQSIHKYLSDKYHNNSKNYRNLLNKPAQKIDKSQIRQFVAQYAQDGTTYHNYLAVREVLIYADFDQDVGAIGLVDMPGLGDKEIANRERLIQSLNQDVDFILFIRRPDAKGDNWSQLDTDLYQTARDELADLGERSFLVINKINEQNEQLCDRFLKQIEDNFINVAESLITDCSSSEESAFVLDRLLTYLVKNIENLDRRYATSIQVDLNKLHDSINSKLNEAPNILASYVKPVDKFNNLFTGDDDRSGFWGELAYKLGSLHSDLKMKITQPDEEFKKKIEEVFNLLDRKKDLPEIEKIKQDKFAEGSYLRVFCIYLDELRAYLSEKFIALDRDMQTSFSKEALASCSDCDNKKIKLKTGYNIRISASIQPKDNIFGQLKSPSKFEKLRSEDSNWLKFKFVGYIKEQYTK